MSSTVDVQICNSALFKLGANRIIGLGDDTPEGRACAEQYPKIKRALLRSHPWSFAVVRKKLNKLVETPAYGYANYFQLTAECLRVLNIQGEESYPWRIEGRKVATDNTEAFAKYISDVDEGMFDETFKEALACALAADLAIPLSQSEERKESLMRDAAKTLREARTYNAQEGVGDRVYADTWLNSRA